MPPLPTLTLAVFTPEARAPGGQCGRQAGLPQIPPLTPTTDVWRIFWCLSFVTCELG